jgi:hypothetical protein
LFDDFSSNQGKGKLHVFISFHRCAIINVFEIKDHAFCVGCGQGAIDETFGGGEAGALSCGDAGVVEAINTDGDTDMMYFVLCGMDGGNKTAIGDFSSDGHLIAPNEKYGVGASRHASADASGQSAKVIGKGLDTETSDGAPGQVTVFQRLASGFIDDRVGQVRSRGLGSDEVSGGKMIAAFGGKVGVRAEGIPMKDGVMRQDSALSEVRQGSGHG